MKETILIIILAVMIFSVNSVNKKIDKLIELNQPEAIQLIVPDKPLLEDK